MDIEFSNNEIAILRELVKGKSYKQISETLYISIPTVKHYITKISEKIGIKRKINIIFFALMNNLV